MSLGSKKKNITIEYYKVCAYDTDENDNSTAIIKECEISHLLEILQKEDAQSRTIDYIGEYVILSTIEYDEVSKLWKMVFFKSRSSTPPFITNKNGASRKIELNNDEMISEALCVEYDPKTCIIIMQRNVYAFGTKCLETFLSSFLNYSIVLESIQNLNQEKRKLLKKNVVKKFKLRIKNVSKGKKDKNDNGSIFQYKKNTTICKVIDSALAVNTAIINIEFSVANSSKAINIQDEDFDVFQDLMNNNNVKCLEIGFAPDEYSTMQITDFMDLRVHDIITLQCTRGNPINTSEILDKMIEKYKENLYLEEYK